MQGGIQQWLRQIDLFGKNITLNMNGSSVYRTNIGGLTTLITAFILVFVFLNSILTFSRKELITAKTSRFFSDSPPLVTLNKTNYMFAVSIQQDDFVTNPYYDIVITYRNDTRDSNGKFKRISAPFPLVQCTPEHWSYLPGDYDWQGKFVAMNFTNWLCPEMGFELNLQGVFSNSIFSYYKISVQNCVSNSTINKTCRTPDEVTAQLKALNGSFRFQLYQSSNIVNADQKEPLNSYLSDVTQYLFSPGKIFVTSNLFYSTIEMQVDNQIYVGKNIETMIVPRFSQGETYTQILPGDDYTFGSFYLRKSIFSDVVVRSYQKVDGLISYIGGFAQSVVFAISFLIRYLVDSQFSVELANKLYEFEAVSDKKVKKSPSGIGGGNSPGGLGPNSNNPDGNGHGGASTGRMSGSSINDPNQLRTSGEEVRFRIKERARSERRQKRIINQRIDPQRLSMFHRDQAQHGEHEKLENNNNNKHEDVDDHQENNGDDGGIRGRLFTELNPPQEHEDEKHVQGQSQQQKLEAQIKHRNQLFLPVPGVTATATAAASSSHKYLQKMDLKDSQFEQKDGSAEQDQNGIKSPPTSASVAPMISKALPATPHLLLQADSTKLGGIVEDGLIKSELMHQQIASTGQTNGHHKLGETSLFRGSLESANKEDTNSDPGFHFKSRRSFLISQFKDLVEKQRKISLNIGYFLNKIFCGKYFNTKQNRLIDRAANEISKDLDVFTLIERIKEVEKLKSVIFEKEQLVLFNFCPKPILSLRENNSNLTRAQILERMKRIQRKKDEAKMQKEYKRGFMKSHMSSTMGGLNLFNKTISAVQKFKQAIITEEQQEINTYKYLYEAYDSIMVQDPNLSKMKNKNLINSLGREMKDIFYTSKLLHFNDETTSKEIIGNSISKIEKSKKMQQPYNGGDSIDPSCAETPPPTTIAVNGHKKATVVVSLRKQSENSPSKRNKALKARTFKDVDLKDCFAMDSPQMNSIHPNEIDFMDEDFQDIEQGGTQEIPDENNGANGELVYFSMGNMTENIPHGMCIESNSDRMQSLAGQELLRATMPHTINSQDLILQNANTLKDFDRPNMKKNERNVTRNAKKEQIQVINITQDIEQNTNRKISDGTVPLSEEDRQFTARTNPNQFLLSPTDSNQIHTIFSERHINLVPHIDSSPHLIHLESKD